MSRLAAASFPLTIRLAVYEVVYGMPAHREYLGGHRRSVPLLKMAAPKTPVPRSAKLAQSISGGPPVPGTWATGARAARAPCSAATWTTIASVLSGWSGLRPVLKG
jgi:hypothetical protein